MPIRGILGLAIVLCALALAAVASVWTPHDVGLLDVAHRLAPPGPAHPLGTDQLGRDLLSMLMAGAVPSLATAAAATLIGLVVGVPVGLVAVTRPGFVDELLSRTGDLAIAIPTVILAMLIVATWGPGASRAALAIGMFNVPVFFRVTRAAGRIVWTQDFILAARLAGKGRLRIALDHILPNVAGALAVQASIQLALGLLAEAGLSFLGLGVVPPQPSWGRMLAEAQTLIAVAPRLVLLPGLCIAATALGFVWLGDALVERLRR